MQTNSLASSHLPSRAFVRNGLRAAAVLAFTLLTAVGAHIQVPVPGTPVPLTLQTIAVLSAGLWLGSRGGALSQVLYVVAGAIGLPLFAGPAGGFVFGPTAGYLIGFVAGAWATGALARLIGTHTLARTWLATFLGSVVLFVPGVLWLKVFTGVSLSQAIALGVIPFILGDLVKVTAVAVGHTAFFSLLKRL